jgi:hypothetical protein
VYDPEEEASQRDVHDGYEEGPSPTSRVAAK